VSLTVSVPGQNPYLTFSGTANQQVRLNVTGVTIPWSLVSMTKPDGTALISPTTSADTDASEVFSSSSRSVLS
jgi:hypothetical protein